MSLWKVCLSESLTLTLVHLTKESSDLALDLVVIAPRLMSDVPNSNLHCRYPRFDTECIMCLYVCSIAYKKGQKGKKEASEQKKKDKEKKSDVEESDKKDEDEEEEEHMDEEPEAENEAEEDEVEN